MFGMSEIDYPKEVTVLEILQSAASGGALFAATETTDPRDGRKMWIPARSIPYLPGGLTALRHRMHCAWLVFRGKADVLHWR